MAKPVALTKAQARRIWLRAQRLDTEAPFGGGPEATCAAVAHLGYVQIDTINVVERCHHQILFTRIPDYRRDDLRQAQSVDKTVFEYWTHALSYVPTADMRFYVRAMKREWHRRKHLPRRRPFRQSYSIGRIAWGDSPLASRQTWSRSKDVRSTTSAMSLVESAG